MTAFYESACKGAEENEESDVGLFILCKLVYGINAFLYSNDDNQPKRTYNEEGEVDNRMSRDILNEGRERLTN